MLSKCLCYSFSFRFNFEWSVKLEHFKHFKFKHLINITPLLSNYFPLIFVQLNCKTCYAD
jgi:hypothetical protein